MHFSPPTLYAPQLWANRRVGILGGSFNPAHDGHRHISLEALKRLNLDAVWWMVSPQNPLKSTNGMASLDARVASALAVSRHPKIIVTDIETALRTRYTADTLAALKRHFPATQFVWLMGGDNLIQMHRWKRGAQIFAQTPVAVLTRPPREDGVRNCKMAERFRRHLKPQEDASRLIGMELPAWTILHIPLSEASSTAIRAKSALRDNR